MNDRGGSMQIAGGVPQRNVMADGSISWGQPDSNGLGGWEGFCGQTATANLLTTHRGVDVSPQEVSRAADDWTPGTHPSTLMRAISRLAPDASQYELRNVNDLSTATTRTPIVCLLQWEGKIFHYVTVIGVTAARVTFNHWGTQDSRTIAEFDGMWAFHRGWDGNVVAWLGGFDTYTSIRHR
jgi:predicted double-glycine peptidase